MVSKILGAFVQFPGIVITITLIYGILKRKKKALILAFILYILSSEFLWIYVQNLWTINQTPVKGDIVVLGGGAISIENDDQLSRSTLMRLLKGFEIWKDYPSRKLILCGGPTPSGITEAIVMKEKLLKMNVPNSAIIVEGKSKNTLENLRYAKRYINGNVNIVTSSTHTRRVSLIAKKLGIDHRIIATDYLIESKMTYRSFLPSAEALDFLSQITHEIVGIVYYKIIGGI